MLLARHPRDWPDYAVCTAHTCQDADPQPALGRFAAADTVLKELIGERGAMRLVHDQAHVILPKLNVHVSSHMAALAGARIGLKFLPPELIAASGWPKPKGEA